MKRALDIPRVEALKKVEKKDAISGRVRFRTTYDPRFPAITDILRKHHKIMVEKDGRLQKIFSQPPVVCYSRPKNLRDELVRAKLPRATGRRSARKKPDGFFKCSDVMCRLCPYTGDPKVRVIKEVICLHTGEKFPIRGHITCKSSGIIYEGHCQKRDKTCPNGAQYIGESGKRAVDRFVGHKGTICQPGQAQTTAPVGVHFRSPGHSLSDFVFVPFEKCYSSDQVRKARESMYIQLFGGLDNLLNKDL